MTNSDLEYFKKLLEERKLQIKKNILDATDEINGLRDSGASDEFDFANISADSILEQSISSKQKQEFARMLGKVRLPLLCKEVVSASYQESLSVQVSINFSNVGRGYRFWG